MQTSAARMDMATRDQQRDESLGLNCAWYADILMTLIESGVDSAPPSTGRKESSRGEAEDAR